MTSICPEMKSYLIWYFGIVSNASFYIFGMLNCFSYSGVFTIETTAEIETLSYRGWCGGGAGNFRAREREGWCPKIALHVYYIHIGCVLLYTIMRWHNITNVIFLFIMNWFEKGLVRIARYFQYQYKYI